MWGGLWLGATGAYAMLCRGACEVRGSNLFAEGVLFLAPTGRPHRSPGQRPISAKITSNTEHRTSNYTYDHRIRLDVHRVARASRLRDLKNRRDACSTFLIQPNSVVIAFCGYCDVTMESGATLANGHSIGSRACGISEKRENGWISPP